MIHFNGLRGLFLGKITEGRRTVGASQRLHREPASGEQVGFWRPAGASGHRPMAMGIG